MNAQEWRDFFCKGNYWEVITLHGFVQLEWVTRIVSDCDSSGISQWLRFVSSSEAVVWFIYCIIMVGDHKYTISNALLLLLIGADGMPLLQLVLDE